MSISSAGIGSGLDVKSIVEQMVAYEKLPLQKLEARAEGIQTQISTYGEIKSLTSKLGDIVSKLTRDSAWNQVDISSSNTTITGTMTGIAAAGVFGVQVDELAQAQTTVISVNTSNLDEDGEPISFTENSRIATDSELKITVKGEEHSIDVGNKTLTEAAAAINEAGLGVQATIIKDPDGSQRLMLRSKETGSEHGFQVSLEGAGSDQLVVPAENAQNAQDAQVRLNGVVLNSSTNTFADAIPGMSFSVSEVTTTAATLTIKSDTAGMKESIKEFVDAYNELNTLLSQSTKYVEDTKTAGVLQGDGATVSLQNSLRMLTQGISGSSGAFTRLSDIGIQMIEGGALMLDGSKLDKSLQDPQSLKALFATKANGLGQGGGIAVNFKSFTDKLLAFDGTLNSKSDALERSLKRNQTDQERVNDRADRVEERLYRQYSSLDTKMASLNALNSYVSQMITTWNRSKDS